MAAAVVDGLLSWPLMSVVDSTSSFVCVEESLDRHMMMCDGKMSSFR